MGSVTIFRTAGAAAFLLAAPAAAVAGPIAYQPQHVGASELPAFTDLPVETIGAAAAEAPGEELGGTGSNQVPSPAGFAIFALAAAGIMGSRVRRRRTD